MNSRPYVTQELVYHRAGHSALPMEFQDNVITTVGFLLKLDPAFQGICQGGLVGVFQVTACWKPAGDAGHFYA